MDVLLDNGVEGLFVKLLPPLPPDPGELAGFLSNKELKKFANTPSPLGVPGFNLVSI